MIQMTPNNLNLCYNDDKGSKQHVRIPVRHNKVFFQSGFY